MRTLFLSIRRASVNNLLAVVVVGYGIDIDGESVLIVFQEGVLVRIS